MWTYANPTHFSALVSRALPWAWGATLSLLAIGLYMTFFIAPADYQQGETVRIMYIHVPAARCGASPCGELGGSGMRA